MDDLVHELAFALKLCSCPTSLQTGELYSLKMFGFTCLVKKNLVKSRHTVINYITSSDQKPAAMAIYIIRSSNKSYED
jgi:hypothetical protein